MRLTLLLLIFLTNLQAQKTDWVYISDSQYTLENPLLLEQGNTTVEISGGFSAGTDVNTIYTDSLFTPLVNEFCLVRYGFSYKIPDTISFCILKAFLSTGGVNPPVPIGEWKISDHQGWVAHQETFPFWVSTDFANDGGKIYWEVSGGMAEIANQNLSIGKLRDELPKPLLEIGNLDNVGDLATSVVAPFTELFQTVNVNTRSDYFTVDLPNASITILKPGVYEYDIGLQMELVSGNGQRNNIAFWLETGTATNTGNEDNPDDNISHYMQSNYLRSSSGHAEVSEDGQGKWIVLTNNEVPFTFRVSRDGRSGASSSQPGGVQTLYGTNNYFHLKKID